MLRLHTVQLRPAGGHVPGTELRELTGPLLPLPYPAHATHLRKACPFKYYLSCTGGELERLSHLK